jgi:hypothetical protein
MSKPTLALIPSGYRTTEVYSVLPSDGTGDFTFVRTGEATRVRKDGLIEAVATTVPRLNWLNSDCPSLLIEPEKTNRQVRSEQFDNAAWTKQADITVTANQVTAPTGELTADKIKRGSTVDANNFLSDASSKSSSAELDACTSVFVKQGEGDFFAFRIQGTYPNRADAIFQFSNTTLTTSVAGADFTVASSKVENYGDGWYRLSVVYNTDAAATITSLFSPRGTTGQIDVSDTSTSAFVYLWGCQVEEGVGSTSYIETPADAAVTRNAETCKIADFSSMPSSYPITVYGEVIPNELSTSSYAFSLLKDVDAVGNYYLAVNLRSTSFVKIIRRDSDTNDEETISHTLAVGKPFKFAVCFQNETNFKYSFDGLTTVSVTTSDIVTWDFGDVLLGALRLSSDNGKRNPIKEFRLYDTELTNAELKELTT